jgi:hypothetical protein
MNVSKKQDLTIKFEMKMSEAQFIVDSLSHFKFKCDTLIENIVGQVNPHLPKPETANDEPNADLPIGISEEIDDKILALFSDEWNDKDDNLDFDFSRTGHVVATCKFGDEKATALIKKIEASGIADELIVNVNREVKNLTVILFSAKPSQPAPLKKVLTEADALADLNGGTSSR